MCLSTGVTSLKRYIKVLTQNIAVILGINRRVEECVEDYLSIKQLNFDQYLYFLVREVFTEVDDGETAYKDLKSFHDGLDETFWDLCRPNFISRHQPILNLNCVFKMFRVFCFLADRSSTTNLSNQVTLPRGEMEEITRFLINELGRDWDQQDFDQISNSMPVFSLAVFLTFLEGRYLQDIEQAALEDAVDEVYQFFVEQVLEKSKLHQRLPWAPVWIARDLEIVPWEIRPSKMKNFLQPFNLKFVTAPLTSFSPQTTVHGIPDNPGAKPRRITVSTEKNLQLAAPDHKLKTRWIRAINIAIQHCKDPIPYQMLLSSARKEDRAHVEEKELEERIRRASQADMIEQTEAELIAERHARAQAEASAREEAAARVNEEKRVQELTNLKQELEALLAQETQAKKDEEIVRALQARVLTEEWEKREELERLQAEQKIILEEEKKKRRVFEKIQFEKESQLKEAQGKLAKLEKDRLKLDNELRNAREKIVMSERGKEIIEARMKVKERTPPSRTYSLRPVRKEPRTVLVRSSSFNTQSTHKKVIPTNPPPLPSSEQLHEEEEEELKTDLPVVPSTDSMENYRMRMQKTNHKDSGTSEKNSIPEISKDIENTQDT